MWGMLLPALFYRHREVQPSATGTRQVRRRPCRACKSSGLQGLVWHQCELSLQERNQTQVDGGCRLVGCAPTSHAGALGPWPHGAIGRKPHIC